MAFVKFKYVEKDELKSLLIKNKYTDQRLYKYMQIQIQFVVFQIIW